MKLVEARVSAQEIRPRHAALVAGLGYLFTPTPFAEFYVWPHLVISENAAQTVHNILTQQGLFAIGILCYLISYVFDVIIAWALYYLLKPVNASLSLLAAWFQIVYTAVGLTASLSLVTVLRLVNTPADAALFGDGPLRAQVRVILASFHANWGLSLIFFGAHLVIVGYLVYKSSYIPKFIGILLAIAGIGYAVQNLNSYLFPEPDLTYVAIALLGELVFMFWLLIWGWRIKEAEGVPIV
jgi:hypothetical protein